MMRTTLLPSLLGLLCLPLMLGLSGCQKKVRDEIDYGTVKDSVYENAYFGMRLPIPKEWSIQDQEMQDRMMETGQQVIAGNDKVMKAQLKASEKQSVSLLAAFQHPIGTPVPFNPSVIISAERVRTLPGIQRGKDYLFHARKMLESGQIKFEFAKELSFETLGEHPFDVLQLSIPAGDTKVHQKYCVTVMKGYALILIASYTTPEEEELVMSVLRGVSFKTP